jgi:hypothetical protein
VKIDHDNGNHRFVGCLAALKQAFAERPDPAGDLLDLNQGGADQQGRQPVRDPLEIRVGRHEGSRCRSGAALRGRGSDSRPACRIERARDSKHETKKGAGRCGSSRHKKVGADKGSNMNVRRSTSYPPGPESNRSKTCHAEHDDGPADPEAGYDTHDRDQLEGGVSTS